MELAGEDKFRFLAYRKAAHALRGWPHPVADAVRTGTLTEIPGVGAEDGRPHRRPIFETGTFPEYEEFARPLPGGPRRGDGSLGRGTQAGRAAARVAGCGLVGRPRERARRREGGAAARLRRQVGRGDRGRHRSVPPPPRAHPAVRGRAAGRPASWPSSRPPAPWSPAEPAGSLRRRKETIGDIDIVVASDDPAAVMEAVAHPAQRHSGGRRRRDQDERRDHRGPPGRRAGRRARRSTAPRSSTSRAPRSTTSTCASSPSAPDSRSTSTASSASRTASGSPARPRTRSTPRLGMDTPPARDPRGRGRDRGGARAHACPRLLELADIRGDLQTHSDVDRRALHAGAEPRALRRRARLRVPRRDGPRSAGPADDGHGRGGLRAAVGGDRRAQRRRLRAAAHPQGCRAQHRGGRVPRVRR